MMDHRARTVSERRVGRLQGRPKHEPRVRIDLTPPEARALRDVLAEDLRVLETEIAGHDWQDLGAETLLRCKLLRKLLEQLEA